MLVQLSRRYCHLSSKTKEENKGKQIDPNEMKFKVKENKKIKKIKKKHHCPVSEPIEFNTKKISRKQLFVAFYFSLLDIMSAF